ncbi:carboxypeptidase regulatory-like domain-containing protein [Candidatus Woesearchaeota archaeon]|nr:carboxypeptidase regulatory-like domain-containing protein [Candidatus Woesearchaeota archaeon]
MSSLENITNEEISRRKFLALALVGALGLAGCKDKKSRLPLPVDTQRPETPDTSPEPSPQEDFHHFSGTLMDTEGNLVQGARVKLRVRNDFRAYEADSDQNGNYRILNVPNGDYVLTLENIPGFFNYEDSVKIISAHGDISRNFFLIGKHPILSTEYGDLLEMLKDVTGNRDGRSGTRPDSVQKVRRFDLAGRVKVFLDRQNSPFGSAGYAGSVESALNEWQSETGLPLFEETNLSRDAKIKFAYSGIGPNGFTQVLEYESRDGVSIIKKAKISIDNNLSLTDVKKVALREVGFVLFSAERYSKDDIHAIFKDPRNPNSISSTGITDDEARVLIAYYGLPIGEDLNPYRS